MQSELRRLRAGDEPLLFDFLDRHVDTSLFLISNAENAGLEDHGKPLQGTYVASFDDGAMTAVACHCWNGNILLQGDRGLEEAVLGAIDRTGRAVKGLMGPVALVSRARAALGLTAARARLEEAERLFTLDLNALEVPPLLSEPQIEFRVPTPAELAGPLAEYRKVYLVETLHNPDSPELLATARAQVEGWNRGGRLSPDGFYFSTVRDDAGVVLFQPAAGGAPTSVGASRNNVSRRQGHLPFGGRPLGLGSHDGQGEEAQLEAPPQTQGGAPDPLRRARPHDPRRARARETEGPLPVEGCRRDVYEVERPQSWAFASLASSDDGILAAGRGLWLLPTQ